jgi:hypothetical protein
MNYSKLQILPPFSVVNLILRKITIFVAGYGDGMGAVGISVYNTVLLNMENSSCEHIEGNEAGRTALAAS